MQTWKIVKKIRKTSKSNTGWKTPTIAFLLVLITVWGFGFNFPSQWNKAAHNIKLPSVFTIDEEPFRLGLDLQGGTHLVYEADMTQISEADRVSALEGVKDVIERRVNAFGVSEPVVQITSTGGAHRVIIELAGIKSSSDAIDLIGQTPVLEFKEAGEEVQRALTQEELTQMETAQTQEREVASQALNRALRGEDFDALINEFSIEPEKEGRGIIKGITAESPFSEFAIVIEEKGLQPGRVYSKVLENEQGLNVFLFEKKELLDESLLSHLRICFEGKRECPNPIPEIEAALKIKSLKEQATPENFAELVKANSTDQAAENGGELGWATPNTYVPAFALAAQSLGVGEISEPVETEFGYHLIYKQDEHKASIKAYDIKRIVMSLTTELDILPPTSPWINTELSGKHLERSGVEFDPSSGRPYVGLNFNSEGGDLFGELTAKHIGEPIAIFLDNEPISVPKVQQAIYGGQAVITGDFTLDEAKLLAQRLNAGALPVPVQLISQQTVGPTLGVISLQKSIQAGLIGFALVALFMIFIYRLPGLVAVIALLFFAMLNLAAYRVFGVTITLAGVAGLVLSIGIAVDANVLITERMIEELRAGRDYNGAVDEAFKRAWSSIRDGNMTTLIAAGVLYWFSSSFIRGFALTLSMGVIISMFSAITASRIYLKTVIAVKALRKPGLFYASKTDRNV